MKTMRCAVKTNSFVRRQTPESQFSHIEPYTVGDAWQHVELYCLNKIQNNEYNQGYREGVILVPVTDAELMRRIYSGVVQLKEGDELTGQFRARREGEEPRKSTFATNGKKMPAKSAFVVLYASTVLAEDGDNEAPAVEGNWEIISLNANPTEDEMPIAPNTLMHNHFGSDGGTATNLSDAEFVEMLKKSFEWWKDKAMCSPKSE